MNEEREPSGTEYMMAAILSYASVYFMSWMLTQNPGVKWVTLLAFPVYFLGAAYSSFLLASRAGHAHLLIGLKSAFYSWVFSGLSLWVLTGTTSFVFLLLLFISMILGGFTGSYVSLRRQIWREVKVELEEPKNTPETDE